MAEFNVRSDGIDVDDIMRQIRARIRDKRGVDYTEADLLHLANVKMEQFLDPRKLRSDLVEQFKQRRTTSPSAQADAGAAPVETGGPLKRLARRVIRRAVTSVMSPEQLAALMNAEFRRREELYYEILHTLVVELTRLGIEVHNLKMRVESLSSRMDFDERRGRALESVVQYRTDARGAAPSGAPTSTSGTNAGQPGPAGAPAQAMPGSGGRPDGERRRRRRRRRRRPGQTLGDRQGGVPPAPGMTTAPGGPGMADAPASAGDEYDAADGPEDNGDGAPEQ